MADGAEAQEPDGAEKPKDPVASIAGQVAQLSTGDRAMLRRLFLTRSYQADGLVAGLLHRAGITAELGPAAFAPWRLVAHVAALMSGTGAAKAHDPGRRLGRALQAAGYSEQRLLRLTAARGQPLVDQIVRAARTVAQAGTGPFNLWDVFNLAGLDAERAEAARLRTAQTYYSAAHHEGSKT